MDLIKEIHDYLSNEISAMNAVIVDSLAVEEELIQVISNHLANAGGKRMRPILTILSAKMFGYRGDLAIRLAAAVEFIHMATLLHDDVIDGSRMRRFLPTANVVWGSKASILVGDFLFSQSFKLIVSTRLIPALEMLSKASAIIAEGEVSQLTKLEQRRIVFEDEYFKVINAKTAELFGAACGVGSIVAGREDLADELKSFGLHLGNIFQIVDDVLDYFSSSSKVGKNVGDDFYEGKVTLPIIILANQLPDGDASKLKDMFAAGTRSEAEFVWVKSKMREFKVQEIITDRLNSMKDNAMQVLKRINVGNDNKPKEYLEKLIDFAIKRAY
ncbi:MAG: polyprenyl synthetase family protein [Rickettsiaceae bacterium]